MRGEWVTVAGSAIHGPGRFMFILRHMNPPDFIRERKPGKYGFVITPSEARAHEEVRGERYHVYVDGFALAERVSPVHRSTYRHAQGWHKAELVEA